LNDGGRKITWPGGFRAVRNLIAKRRGDFRRSR